MEKKDGTIKYPVSDLIIEKINELDSEVKFFTFDYHPNQALSSDASTIFKEEFSEIYLNLPVQEATIMHELLHVEYTKPVEPKWKEEIRKSRLSFFWLLLRSWLEDIFIEEKLKYYYDVSDRYEVHKQALLEANERTKNNKAMGPGIFRNYLALTCQYAYISYLDHKLGRELEQIFQGHPYVDNWGKFLLDLISANGLGNDENRYDICQNFFKELNLEKVIPN